MSAIKQKLTLKEVIFRNFPQLIEAGVVDESGNVCGILPKQKLIQLFLEPHTQMSSRKIFLDNALGAGLTEIREGQDPAEVAVKNTAFAEALLMRMTVDGNAPCSLWASTARKLHTYIENGEKNKASVPGAAALKERARVWYSTALEGTRSKRLQHGPGDSQVGGAHYNLGRLIYDHFADNDGADLEEAIMHFIEAARHGHAEAIRDLAQLMTTSGAMTAEDITKSKEAILTGFEKFPQQTAGVVNEMLADGLLHVEEERINNPKRPKEAMTIVHYKFVPSGNMTL